MAERLQPLLEQAAVSLDYAVITTRVDPDAALDDVLAAGLLVLTALATEVAAHVVG